MTLDEWNKCRPQHIRDEGSTSPRDTVKMPELGDEYFDKLLDAKADTIILTVVV